MCLIGSTKIVVLSSLVRYGILQQSEIRLHISVFEQSGFLYQRPVSTDVLYLTRRFNMPGCSGIWHRPAYNRLFSLGAQSPIKEVKCFTYLLF
jgi:hypothetical protein